MKDRLESSTAHTVTAHHAAAAASHLATAAEHATAHTATTHATTAHDRAAATVVVVDFLDDGAGTKATTAAHATAAAVAGCTSRTAEAHDDFVFVRCVVKLIYVVV